MKHKVSTYNFGSFSFYSKSTIEIKEYLSIFIDIESNNYFLELFKNTKILFHFILSSIKSSYFLNSDSYRFNYLIINIKGQNHKNFKIKGDIRMRMNSFEIEKIDSFLADFSGITFSYKEKEHNFIDICGFPRYENVMSNILAYFFDIEGQHGFKDLWLKSLLEVYETKANKTLTDKELTIENIERESSAGQKRIDLFIVTNNAVIVIENKIYARPNNPFGEYHKKAKNSEGNKTIVEILLTIKKEENQQKDEYNFINITYKELFSKIESNIGDYILNINHKWFTFMIEFIKNISNIYEREHMVINKALQEKYIEKKYEIQNFINLICNDINAKIEYFEQINDYIKGKGEEGTYIHNNFKNKVKGHFSLVKEFKIRGDKNKVIVFEPYVLREKPEEIVIAIWNRENENYDYNDEKNALENLKNLKYKITTSNEIADADWGKYIILDKKHFSEIDTNIEVLGNEFYKIISTLKELYNSQGLA